MKSVRHGLGNGSKQCASKHVSSLRSCAKQLFFAAVLQAKQLPSHLRLLSLCIATDLSVAECGGG